MTGPPEDWLPIRYRDFHDVPRAFVVEHRGQLLFFDCPFDDALDDYPDHYSVIRLPPAASTLVSQASWTGLASEGTVIGRIPVREVRFDPSRRAAIDAAVLTPFPF